MTIFSPLRRLGAAAAFGAAMATVTGGTAGAVSVELTPTTFNFSVTGNQTAEQIEAGGLFKSGVTVIPGTVDFAFTIETEGALADGLYFGSEDTLSALIQIARAEFIDLNTPRGEAIELVLGFFGYGSEDLLSGGNPVIVPLTYSVTAPDGHSATTISGTGADVQTYSLIGVRDGAIDAIYFMFGGGGKFIYLSVAPEGKAGFDYAGLNSPIVGGFFSNTNRAPKYATVGAGAAALQLTPPAPVPLPAGGVLMLTALGGLGFLARRRKAA